MILHRPLTPLVRDAKSAEKDLLFAVERTANKKLQSDSRSRQGDGFNRKEPDSIGISRIESVGPIRLRRNIGPWGRF
jgi:hypothetical protein